MNIKKIVLRLIDISNKICYEIDDLAELSLQGLEETLEFNEHIEFLENYLEQESEIVDNTSYENLLKIFECLANVNINNEAYFRCYTVLDDKINELLNQDEEEIEDDQDSLKFELGIDMISNNYVTKTLHEYYEDDQDNYKYYSYIVRRNAIIAIKNMFQVMKNTPVDNKVDEKYLKKLLWYFNSFKYSFFSIDRETEKLGIKYKFDIHKIPTIYDLDLDYSNVKYNECLDLLSRFYTTSDKERDILNISQALYDMMCFDEYLSDLDINYIDRLIEFCYSLEERKDRNLYGNIGLKKLIKKRDNKN